MRVLRPPPRSFFAQVLLVGLDARAVARGSAASALLKRRKRQTNSGNFTEWVTQLRRTVSRGASNEEISNEGPVKRPLPLNKRYSRAKKSERIKPTRRHSARNATDNYFKRITFRTHARNGIGPTNRSAEGEASKLASMTQRRRRRGNRSRALASNLLAPVT